MDRPECIVLDLDDTLFLERDYVRSGFAHIESWASQEWGLVGLGDTSWKLFVDGVRGDTFNRAAALLRYELTPLQVEGLVRQYRTHAPTLSLSTERAAALDALSQAYDLAVLTGGNPEAQRRKLDALGISSRCCAVVFAGAWGPACDKPHARGWQAVEAATGLSGTQLLYVADNPTKDWPACQERSWQFVRVRMPESIHGSVDTPPDIAEIADVAAMPALLEEAYHDGFDSRGGRST